jgi:hypothetical protein
MAGDGVKYATLEVWFESVAQLVEHRPFKALVLGSSPSALTKQFLISNLAGHSLPGFRCSFLGGGTWRRLSDYCPFAGERVSSKADGRMEASGPTVSTLPPCNLTTSSQKANELGL